MTSEYSTIFKFLLCFAAVISIQAYKEIKAYRLVQYEKEEVVYGSQYSSLNYIGSHHKGDTLRKIALIKFKELTSIESLEKFVNSNANALLIMLPSRNEITEQLKNFIVEAQQFLSEKVLYIPVYFANESEDLNEIYEELELELGITNEGDQGVFGLFQLENNLLQFSMNVNEPKKVESIQLENLLGYLEGSPTSGSSNPVIAIVANYDDLSIVPDMPRGLNSNASGIIAIVELMRIMSKFYENYESFVHYDLLFLLTSGGNLNYSGTQHFINSLDSNTLDNLQFVLCLDSLADLDSSNLYLHISRHPRETDESAYRFQRIFNNTISNMGIDLEYTKKKVFSDGLANWEHEQFSKKKVLSATLSSKKDISTSAFARNFLIDNELSKEELKKNIKLIAETLVSFLFDIEKITIFKDDDTIIDDKNISFLSNFFTKNSRTPLNIVKGSLVNSELFNIFTTYLTKTQRQTFEFKDRKFFDANSGIIKVHSVKSKMIDLYILFAIIIYLIVLYVYVKGVKKFYKSIVSDE